MKKKNDFLNMFFLGAGELKFGLIFPRFDWGTSHLLDTPQGALLALSQKHTIIADTARFSPHGENGNQ